MGLNLPLGNVEIIFNFHGRESAINRVLEGNTYPG
jgi:hypothetical protein